MPLFQVCRYITYDYTYEVEANDENEAVDFAFDDVEGKYSSAVSLTHCEQVDSEVTSVEKISWQVFYLCTIVITVKQTY